jgi:hypothetical protein
MSATEDPEGREHVGDGYVTYSRCKQRRPRPNFPPFPPSLEEEEEHAEKQREEQSARPSTKQREG